MKKLWMLVLTLALIFTMAGCMRSEDTLVLNADGSGSSTTLLEVKKSAYDEIVKEMGIGQETNLFGDETPTVVTKDGEEYYQIKKETTFASLEELKKALAESYQNVIVTEDSIRFCLGATMTQADYEEAKAVYSQKNMDLDAMLTATLHIQMPSKIEAVSSKGTIGADGNTATFTLHTADFVNPVEFMVSTAKEETAPTISGVTKNQVYNKPITIKVNDASGIAEATYQKGSAAAVFSPAEGQVRYAVGSAALDVRPFGKLLNERFCGRGGGKPQMVQGNLGAGAEEAALRAFVEEKL